MFFFLTRRRWFFSFTVSSTDTKITQKHPTHNAAPVPCLGESQYFSQPSPVIFKRCRPNVYNGWNEEKSLYWNCVNQLNIRCGYKITGLVWKIWFIFKILQFIVIPFNVLPPLSPPSIRHCIQIFHCSKQCCRSSADTLFSRYSVFYFTSLTDWKWVPFNAFFSLGNR
jgi:hypothetical protein